MLFNAKTLAGIASGHVTVTFRRWRQARVKVGSQTRTPIGVVEVESVHVLGPDEVTTIDALSAGHASVDELLAWVDAKGQGDLYRIGIRLAGPDPRVALREDADLGPDDAAELARRLDGMDAAAERPWTRQTLDAIARRPATSASVLADELGDERALFKRRVRRLKELGLTESLPTGYRLSPRGDAFLRSAGIHRRVDDGASPIDAGPA